MSNENKRDKIKGRSIGDGYQPDTNGKPQSGHTPERSEAKPTNPPKKR